MLPKVRARTVALVACAACAIASGARPARAIVAEVARTGVVPLASTVRMGDPAAQRRLSASPAWQAFRARYGDWRAEWNEATGTPHRAIGPGIPLPGFAPDSAGVDAARCGA
jgi:hypothetical protein